MKVSEYAKQCSVTKMTVYRWVKKGLVPFKRFPTGTILILDEALERDREDFTVVYARVSSSQNKVNLESQAERVTQFCNAKGWQVKRVIKECASGLNDNRPKLLKLLKDEKVTRIVVEHKDRLTRFGFNFIKLLPIEIVVINEVNGDREDLVQDFVSLVTSFSARLYGRRRSRRNTEKLIKEMQKND